jgi:hypothetical protein
MSAVGIVDADCTPPPQPVANVARREHRRQQRDIADERLAFEFVDECDIGIAERSDARQRCGQPVGARRVGMKSSFLPCRLSEWRSRMGA